MDYAISIRKKYCFCLMWYTWKNGSVSRELSISSIIVPSRVGISKSQKISLKNCLTYTIHNAINKATFAS